MLLEDIQKLADRISQEPGHCEHLEKCPTCTLLFGEIPALVHIAQLARRLSHRLELYDNDPAIKQEAYELMQIFKAQEDYEK